MFGKEGVYLLNIIVYRVPKFRTILGNGTYIPGIIKRCVSRFNVYFMPGILRPKKWPDKIRSRCAHDRSVGRFRLIEKRRESSLSELGI